MKLIKTNTVNDWRKIFQESLQVDYADIPTGETFVHVNKEGQETTKMRTVSLPSLGFQTETGRGKGMQWIPVSDLDEVMERLNFYAENGVETVKASDEWLSPAQAIDDTICRVPRLDSDGKAMTNDNGEPLYNIAFRVRKAKGSKSCIVPEEDFPVLVSMLNEVLDSVPEALKTVEARRAEAQAKAAKSENSED